MNQWAVYLVLLRAGADVSRIVGRVMRGRARGMTVRQSVLPKKADRVPGVTEVA